MQFKDYLVKTQKEIEEELFFVLDRWLKEGSGYNASLVPYLNTFINACRGGKGLRGVLIKLGFDLAKGRNPDIIKVAAAYEIFQTAILVHDDLIDKSKLRRGIPSVYVALGGDHYAVSQAICLGDAGNFLSVRLISETGFDCQIKEKAIRLMLKIMHDTTLGQMLDVEGAKKRKGLTEDDILDIYYRKTANYSFIGPLQIGAVLGGLDEDYLNKLEVIGKYLGIAYQIQDDLWVVGGEEEVLGKSVQSDIMEGKATLIYCYAYKHTDKRKRQFLDKYYGNVKITAGQTKVIKNIFVSTGAVNYSINKVKDYLNRTLKEIDNLTAGREVQKMLVQFTEYLFERKK